MSERQLPKNIDELEQMLGIPRTEPKSYTRRDIEELTRRRLGPLWGKKRSPQKPK